MVKNITKILLPLSIVFSLELLAQGSDAPKTPETKWYDKVNFSGYVDVYYNYTLNNRQGGTQDTAGTFHTYNKQFAVNAVKLAIEKVPEESSRWGFRMDWQNGQNPMYQERPYQTTNSIHNMQLLQQGYVSLFVPIPKSKGMIIDVGKMATHIGNEVLDSKDNMNYTIGYIFFNTIPFIHTGARANITWSDRLSTALYMYNSAQGTGYTGGSGNQGQQFGATCLSPYGETGVTPAGCPTNTTNLSSIGGSQGTGHHAYVDGPNPTRAFGSQVKFDAVEKKIKLVWNTLYGDDNLKGRQSDADFYAQQYISGYTLPARKSTFAQDNWFINHSQVIFTPNSKLTILLDWTFGQRKGETIGNAYGYLNPDFQIDSNRDGTIGAGDIKYRGEKRDVIKIYNTYGIWTKYQFNDWFATAFRWEFIDDSRYGGALVVNAPGFAQTPRHRYDLQALDAYGLRYPSSRGMVQTFTLTPTFNITENMIIKIDLRRDQAIDRVFIDEKGRAQHYQHGIILGIVAKF
ncbi:MAG: outer membrane beta-barrel protein [Leptospiraceae bacterium]|nr:outer membrane beta-barrel protein [Leptospiraceae bacterium]